MIRVEIKSELLSWTRERPSYDLDALGATLPEARRLGRGTARPTLKQIEKFASATRSSER